MITVRKINVKKKDYALHLRSYLPISWYWPRVSCIYEIIIAFIFSREISYILDTLQKISRIYLHSYPFTLQHYFYIRMQ